MAEHTIELRCGGGNHEKVGICYCVINTISGSNLLPGEDCSGCRQMPRHLTASAGFSIQPIFFSQINAKTSQDIVLFLCEINFKFYHKFTEIFDEVTILCGMSFL